MTNLLKLQEMEAKKDFNYAVASCTSCGSDSCNSSEELTPSN